MTPRLVILAAPSGSGKTTIARRLEAARSDIGFSVSGTTRAPRENEQNGVDYHFFSPEEFRRRVDAGEFLEWAEYAGHQYGTLAPEVERLIDQGRHVLLDIEVQGAAQVREARPDTVAIFLLPPSVDVLMQRLTGRRTESDAQQRRRMARADRELAQALSFDHIVVNDDLDTAVAAVSAIIDGRAAMPAANKTEYVAELRRELRARMGPPDEDSP